VRRIARCRAGNSYERRERQVSSLRSVPARSPVPARRWHERCSALLCGAVIIAATPVPAIASSAPVVSGGVGEAERALLRRHADDYNLWLVCVERGTGHYLADVRVSIADAQGNSIVDTVANGPWLFARVPPGRYDVRVAGGTGRTVTVGASGQTKTVLRLAR
jgi:hypothetical protein